MGEVFPSVLFPQAWYASASCRIVWKVASNDNMWDWVSYCGVRKSFPVGRSPESIPKFRLDKGSIGTTWFGWTKWDQKNSCVPLFLTQINPNISKYPPFILRFLSLTRVLQVRSFTTILEAGLVGQLVVDQAAASTRELSYLPRDRANPVDNTTIQCWAPSAGHPASSWSHPMDWLAVATAPTRRPREKGPGKLEAKTGQPFKSTQWYRMVPEVIYSIHPGCQPDEGHFFCRNQHVLTVQFLSFGSLRARGSDVSEDAKLLSLRFLDSLITTSRWHHVCVCVCYKCLGNPDFKTPSVSPAGFSNSIACLWGLKSFQAAPEFFQHSQGDLTVATAENAAAGVPGGLSCWRFANKPLPSKKP